MLCITDEDAKRREDPIIRSPNSLRVAASGLLHFLLPPDLVVPCSSFSLVAVRSPPADPRSCHAVSPTFPVAPSSSLRMRANCSSRCAGWLQAIPETGLPEQAWCKSPGTARARRECRQWCPERASCADSSLLIQISYPTLASGLARAPSGLAEC